MRYNQTLPVKIIDLSGAASSPLTRVSRCRELLDHIVSYERLSRTFRIRICPFLSSSLSSDVFETRGGCRHHQRCYRQKAYWDQQAPAVIGQHWTDKTSQDKSESTPLVCSNSFGMDHRIWHSECGNKDIFAGQSVRSKSWLSDSQTSHQPFP